MFVMRLQAPHSEAQIGIGNAGRRSKSNKAIKTSMKTFSIVGLMAMALSVLSPSVLGAKEDEQHLRRLEEPNNAPGNAEAASGQAQGGDQEHWGYGGYGYGYGYPYYHYPYYHYPYYHYPYYHHYY